MVTIQRGDNACVAILCEDMPGGLPRQRLAEAWGEQGVAIYPLALASLAYIEGDLICCGRLENRRWKALNQVLGYEASNGGHNGGPLPGTYILQPTTIDGRQILFCLGSDLSGLLYAIEALIQRATFSPDGLIYQGQAQTE